MMTRLGSLTIANFALSVLAAFGLGGSLAAAQTETVIHSFQSSSVTDGAVPTGGLVADQNGALYGTTQAGGKYRGGTVFKLAPPAVQGGEWKQNILYAFTGGTTNAGPWGTLVMDSTSGKLYGGTFCTGCAEVFELSPPSQPRSPWSEIVIYNSASATITSLISDGKGKLYGTTSNGGRHKAGSIFVLSFSGGAWKEQDLYSFQLNYGGPVNPGGLVLGPTGALYGVTSEGGVNSSGGTIFSLTPPSSGRGAWTESDLYVFLGGDGALPIGPLVLDGAGAIYGTTAAAGEGDGNVFQLSPPAIGASNWTLNVLYSFQGGSDGAQPASGVVFDSAGALYGNTQFGGDFSCSYDGTDLGCGVSFKLLPPSAQGGAWTEETLHGFSGGADGVDPGLSGMLLVGKSLYGTTLQGGNPQFCYPTGCGTVFSITQ